MPESYLSWTRLLRCSHTKLFIAIQVSRNFFILVCCSTASLARKKQGGSQSSNDNAKGPSKNAGAQLRHYGEQALCNVCFYPILNLPILTDPKGYLRSTGRVGGGYCRLQEDMDSCEHIQSQNLLQLRCCAFQREWRTIVDQLAVKNGHEEMVHWLLEGRTDPTIPMPAPKIGEADENESHKSDASESGYWPSSSSRWTAYNLTHSKPIQDIFWRCAAAHPTWWDRLDSAARVPSALSQEMEEGREEKKLWCKGLKDWVKEREAWRPETSLHFYLSTTITTYPQPQPKSFHSHIHSRSVVLVSNMSKFMIENYLWKLVCRPGLVKTRGKLSWSSWYRMRLTLSK